MVQFSSFSTAKKRFDFDLLPRENRRATYWIIALLPVVYVVGFLT